MGKVITGTDPQRRGQLRTAAIPIRKDGVSLTETPAIYDRNPSPGLQDYPSDAGKGDIPVKFAETGIGNAGMQVNKMRQAKGVMREGLPKIPTTSTVNKKSNNTRKVGKPKQFGGK
jgi:hypothetical protein